MQEDLYQKDTAGHLNAYIINPLYKENTFVNQSRIDENIPTFEQSKKFLPEPIFEENETAIQANWKAWEIGFGNLKEASEKNHFIKNFINMKFNALRGNIREKYKKIFFVFNVLITANNH